MIHQIRAAIDLQEDDTHDRICRQGFDGSRYAGKQSCRHNVAEAFIHAKRYLTSQVSPDEKEWTWGQTHVNEYPNHPWSLTPLKPIWHREVPAGGNSHTASVSRYLLANLNKGKIFKAVHTANFKQVIKFNPEGVDDVNLMTIDTGASGNLFGAHYFSMNADHMKGKLRRVHTDFRLLEKNLEGDGRNYVLKVNGKEKRASGQSNHLLKE